VSSAERFGGVCVAKTVKVFAGRIDLSIIANTCSSQSPDCDVVSKWVQPDNKSVEVRRP
jgi:hypothetical protein